MKPRTVKKCEVCGNLFTPFQTTQKACSLKCAQRHSEALRIKKSARQGKVLLRQKDRADSLRGAQKAFNEYIRMRDFHKPCISCGITTGQMHAGHYRTTAAASQLRFDTRNVHKQCSQCNSSKSGNIVEYRKELVERIGLAGVVALENNSETRKYSINYLRRLARIFRRRARYYRRLRGV